MLLRRYSYFLLQVGLVSYLLGSLFYYFGRKTSVYKNAITSIANTAYWELKTTESTESYTVGPPYVSNGITVTLPPASNTTERQKAAFIALVRNSELQGMLDSMKDVGNNNQEITKRENVTYTLYTEDRFNHKFNYPWIFLNEEQFTEEFIESTTKVASSKTHYGFVNESMWSYPDWIDQKKAAMCREELSYVPYGTSESYRHMCRFQR